MKNKILRCKMINFAPQNFYNTLSLNAKHQKYCDHRTR
jgi:hypothetical protein